MSLGFPKFPNVASKASRNHRILLSTLLCTSARKEAQILLHPRKRKQTWDFYSPQVFVGTLAHEGAGCGRTQARSQTAALVYQWLTSSPSALPPLPVSRSRHPHPGDASARCPQALAALFHSHR